MNPAWPLAYAADFVSYLLQHLPPRDVATLELIAIFGSAARGEATRDSDVDLFIQSSKPDTLERKVTTVIADFETSARVLDYWRPLGVRLPLSVKVGRSPSAFSAIPDALVEHGKVLYAPYRAVAPRPHARQRGVIFAWENISNPTSRNNIYRNLFGYVSHGKRYPGLVATTGGRRLTKGAIWVPLEHLVAVERLFRKNRVTCQLMRVADEAPPRTAARLPPPAGSADRPVPHHGVRPRRKRTTLSKKTIRTRSAPRIADTGATEPRIDPDVFAAAIGAKRTPTRGTRRRSTRAA